MQDTPNYMVKVLLCLNEESEGGQNNMPSRKVSKNCYRWGKTGKKYCGEGAKEKSQKQGRAIYASGWKGK